MKKKARSKKPNAKSRVGSSTKSRVGTSTKSRAVTSTNKTRKRYGAKEPVVDRRMAGSNSGKQSGDFQGLRNLENADSESVNDLLEEGNAFEAGAVAGVEQADDNEGREVHTREVPEDDVPEEYLDKD
jgi:hypothetical protein